MELEQINSPLPPRKEKTTVVEEQNENGVEETIPVVVSPRIVEENNKKNKIGFKNNLWWVIIGAGLLIVWLILLLVFPKDKDSKENNNQTVTLNYWGLWEEPSVINGIITDFESKNPGIKINYKNNQLTDYRTRLGGRLSKTGENIDEEVDIYRIHNTWVPMFREYLSSVPTELVTKIGLEDDYWEGYEQDLKENGQWLSVPIMYDGLALFYNQELLEAAKIPVPDDWWELEKAAKSLTVKDDRGEIVISGLGMGVINGNVDHWSDILGLMMIQNGINFNKLTTEYDKNIEDVFKYYDYFASTTDNVWSEKLPNTTALFASGKLAFYFGPSWRVFDIEKLNKNLKYGITKVPQLPIRGGIRGDDTELTDIHWATYWSEGVNNRSKHQNEAWKFVEYLSSKEVLEKLHTAESQLRSFGEIYPRKSMSENLKSNPKLLPFLLTADRARSWYLASATEDNGLNTEMQNYFIEANIGINESDKVSEAVTDLKNNIKQLQVKYGLKK